MVEQSPGRDAINLSPSIAITGGGIGVVLLAVPLLFSMVRNRRNQQMLKLFIGALEDCSDTTIKDCVKLRAKALGIEWPVHKTVSRYTG